MEKVCRLHPTAPHSKQYVWKEQRFEMKRDIVRLPPCLRCVAGFIRTRRLLPRDARSGTRCGGVRVNTEGEGGRAVIYIKYVAWQRASIPTYKLRLSHGHPNRRLCPPPEVLYVTCICSGSQEELQKLIQRIKSFAVWSADVACPLLPLNMPAPCRT